jgi:glycine cleavage system H protein
MLDEKNLQYAPTHEWVHVEGDTATVGLTRFAVEQLSDLILIDLPSVGRRVEAGKSFGEVESVKSVSDLYAPVSGEVVAVNPAVADDVQQLAQDPFGAGWLIKVRLDDKAELGNLLDYDAYQAQIADADH